MKASFTPYQKFVIALLAILQFSIILDFMILSPLGPLLLHDLALSTQQFGMVVSSYAFSAGIASFLAAGFSDRFDRKKMLLFFYAGFIIGTLCCGLANSFHTLLAARIVTGLFGGVIGSISLAIIADMFHFHFRGQVMGYIQSAFSASQVLGLPIGLFLSNHFGWHAPFYMITGISLILWITTYVQLQPLSGHLGQHIQVHPILHLWNAATKPRYIAGFAATILLATGGFMLMPFGSAFTVHNLGIPFADIPLVYMVTGIVTIIAGPYLGKLSDRLGKYFLFVLGSLSSIALVLYYTQLGTTPLWTLILINSALFVGISARMVSATALTSAVPDAKDRGAYMSINSSLQQLAGGVASSLAGWIVIQTPSGKFEHYEYLGYVVTAAMLITLVLMFNVNSVVKKHLATQAK